MFKATKKFLWMPSMHALNKAGGGGGGGPTALYTSPTLDTNDANQDTSFRIAVPITGNSGTQIRATIQPGTTNSLTILHASIGKRGSTWDTTATPIELLFSGASGFTGATTAKTSDWANLSGLTFTTGEYAIVIFDIPTGGTTASQRLVTTATGVQTYYKDSIQSWNVTNPVSMNTTAAGTNYCIVSVETQ